MGIVEKVKEKILLEGDVLAGSDKVVAQVIVVLEFSPAMAFYLIFPVKLLI